VVSFAFTIGIAYALRYIFPHEHEYYWLVAGAVAFVSGSLGDLALSVIRRDLGVKDMGVFIWGRGGILDLMDRMIFVAPIYFYALKWLHEGHL
jgi:phosphatidate cytidylyltransferase